MTWLIDDHRCPRRAKDQCIIPCRYDTVIGSWIHFYIYFPYNSKCSKNYIFIFSSTLTCYSTFLSFFRRWHIFQRYATTGTKFLSQCTCANAKSYPLQYSHILYDFIVTKNSNYLFIRFRWWSMRSNELSCLLKRF